MLHWTQAIVLTAAWATGSILGALHEYLGYAAGDLLVSRVAWGFVACGHARFSSFVTGLAATREYARTLVAGSHRRYLGHNPLGGWMILWLLGCGAASALAITGALYMTDWLWGYGWLANLHVALGWVLLAAVAIHVAGVIAMSLRHRENLVAAMFTGRKRGPEGNDVA